MNTTDNIHQINALLYGTEEGIALFKGRVLHAALRFPVTKGERWRITIESTNSEWRQGISCAIYQYKGGFKSLGEQWKHNMYWEDNVREWDIEVIATEDDKPRNLIIHNIWWVERFKRANSRMGGAGIYIEEIPDGWRCFCNDGHLDENFDDIVFTVVKLSDSV